MGLFLCQKKNREGLKNMEKNNTTISINIPNPMVGIERIKNTILNSSVNFYNGPVRQTTDSTKNIFKNFENPFKNLKSPNFKLPRFNKKLLIRLALPVFVVLAFVLGAIGISRNFNTTTANPIGGNQAVVVPDAVAKIDLNRNFTFPLRDADDKQVGDFNYIIENAELRKQIIVKGQRATAVEGRIFLIINLKITNNLAQEMELPSRAYLRVIVNNNNELLAADIHNDPVEVLGKSTKYTRLGLAINEEDAEKTIKLLVGEIEGEKQTVELNFK